jgi:hypothetical protein
MAGNRDQQNRRGNKNDAAPARAASAQAGRGNRASRLRGRRRRPVDDGVARQNAGRGVGSLGLELEGRQQGRVGSLNLPLEGSAGSGVGSLGLELEGRDGNVARRPGLGTLDLELEGNEREGEGSLGLDLE